MISRETIGNDSDIMNSNSCELGSILKDGIIICWCYSGYGRILARLLWIMNLMKVPDLRVLLKYYTANTK